jgi:hypothetical protein
MGASMGKRGAHVNQNVGIVSQEGGPLICLGREEGCHR